MDEIIDLAELYKVFKGGHTRSSARCFRCKTKRIRCSYDFPTCTNCEAEGTECFAWMKGVSKPVPRSLAIYLEERIAQLEIKLDELRQHRAIDEGEEQSYVLAKYAATPFLDSLEFSEDVTGESSFSSLYFRSTNLPSPFDNGVRGNMKQFIEQHPPVDFHSIPREVVQILMHNYIEYYSPQYPIISSLILKDIEHRVFDEDEDASPFDIAVTCIALAISAATLSNRGEKHALASSSVLFSAFISQISSTKWNNKIRKLQISLLIAHYAFANPYAADVWYTLREALRLCLDLGLHKEADSEFMTPLETDMRRRLFLVCTSMSRHLSAVLKVAFPIPRSVISVGYPTIVDDSCITNEGIDYNGPPTKAAAVHFYQFRLYETEVHEVLWLNKEVSTSIEDWLDYLESKTEQWFVKAEEFAKVNQLRFRLISKASLQSRLRRRTPRIPNPSRSSFVKLVNSLVTYIDEYVRDSRTGQVFYLLMGVHYIEEAVVSLLDVIWNQDLWILDFFSFEFLDSKIKACLDLLTKFGDRWPDIKKGEMLPTLADLYSKASKRLRVISQNRNNTQNVERLPEVTLQIDRLLFPQNEELILNNSVPTSEDLKDFNSLNGDGFGYKENLVLAKQSNWEDHFIVDKLNFDDYIGDLDGYI